MVSSNYSKGCTGWLIVAAVAMLVAVAAVLTIREKHHHHRDVLPVPGPPGTIDKKYADALAVALQFFQIQKCSFLFSQLQSLLLFSQLYAQIHISRGCLEIRTSLKIFLTLFVLI